MSLLQEGKSREALRIFEDGLKTEPHNVQLLNAAGSALMLMNEFDQAGQHFAQAISVQPRFIPAHKNLGISLWMGGKGNEARKEFELVLRADPKEPTAKLFLGLIAARQRDFPSTIRYLEQTPSSLLENRPEALLALAGSYYECNRPEDGTATIRRIRLLPALPVEWASLAGKLAADHGAYEEALSLLDIASKQSRDPATAVYNLAFVHYKLGHFSQARELVGTAIERGKQTGDLYNLLGWISEQAGDTREAVNALRRAIELEPLREEHYLDLSTICLEHQGTDDLAGEIIDIGLQRIPNSYHLLVQRGVIQEKRGRHSEALQSFHEAQKLHPEYGLALLSEGITYWQANNLAEAVQCFKLGIRRFPKDYRFHYFYGLAGEKLNMTAGGSAGNFAEARDALTKAIDLEPSFPDSHFVLGKIYFRTQHVKEAQREFERTLVLNPAHVEAKYWLAKIYQQIGRGEEAAKLAGEVGEARRRGLEEESQMRIVLIRK
jgi:tetratricopeptide (TPR) repeat protein